MAYEDRSLLYLYVIQGRAQRALVDAQRGEAYAY